MVLVPMISFAFVSIGTVQGRACERSSALTHTCCCTFALLVGSETQVYSVMLYIARKGYICINEFILGLARKGG